MRSISYGNDPWYIHHCSASTRSLFISMFAYEWSRDHPIGPPVFTRDKEDVGKCDSAFYLFHFVLLWLILLPCSISDYIEGVAALWRGIPKIFSHFIPSLSALKILHGCWVESENYFHVYDLDFIVLMHLFYTKTKRQWVLRVRNKK